MLITNVFEKNLILRFSDFVAFLNKKTCFTALVPMQTPNGVEP
jgi:hypothetical protein